MDLTNIGHARSPRATLVSLGVFIDPISACSNNLEALFLSFLIRFESFDLHEFQGAGFQEDLLKVFL